MAATLTAPTDRATFSAEVKIGTMTGYARNALPVIVDIELRPQAWGLELGMSGHIGEASYGQIYETVEEGIKDGSFTPYIPAETVERMITIWHRWHLNGLRHGCTHQRAMGWEQPGQYKDKNNAPNFFRALGPVLGSYKTAGGDFAEVALPHAAPAWDGSSASTAGGHIFTPAIDPQKGTIEQRKKTITTLQNGRRVRKTVTDYANPAGTWDLGQHGPILISLPGKYGTSYAAYTDGGILGRPCPACGHGFGNTWEHEEMPAAIVEEVRAWAELTPTAPKGRGAAPKETESLTQFADRLGLAVRFARNQAADTEHQLGYKYTMIRHGSAEQMTGPFSSGRANDAPTLADLLPCLSMDVQTAEDCPTWEDYTSEYGDESHKAHTAWESCHRERRELIALIGKREISRLAEAVEAGG